MKQKKNPVAKFANLYNKATVQRDKKNDYKRKDKHRGHHHDGSHPVA